MIFKSPYYRPMAQASATPTAQPQQQQGMGWSAIQDALSQAGAYNPFASAAAPGFNMGSDQWNLQNLYQYGAGAQQGDEKWNLLDSMANLYMQQNPGANVNGVGTDYWKNLNPLQKLFTANPFFGQQQYDGSFGK